MQNLKKVIKFFIKTNVLMTSGTLLCAQQNAPIALDPETQELLYLCISDSFNLEKNQKAIALIHDGASITLPLQNHKSSYCGKTALEIIALRLAQEKVPVVQQLMAVFKEAIEQAHQEVEQTKATVKKALPPLLQDYMPRTVAAIIIGYYSN